jgi:hypothetical protein
MLAVFCLRLALGMLFSLVFLSPKQMHPRFFRTHFLTVLGLSIVALFTGWSTTTEEHLVQHNYDSGMLVRRAALVIAVVGSLLGALVWVYERPPAGWALLVVSGLAQLVALAMADAQEDLRLFVHPRSNPPPFGAVILSDLTSAALLGFAVTAMLVGHSYLISPGLTIRPLMGQIAGLGIALLARIGVAGTALWLWAGEHDITNLNDINVLWLPVRWLVGFVGPLVFGWMAYRTAKIRSTQSATGILYVVVILTFLGELFGLLLTRNAGLPL